ncbi:hypothetical protein B0T14DRAFT_343471 [Immersiella caudata]|uniref:Uncharacterized protein n=1 Tax=Immersiella caudata TaxID=314043 RepID=A0AA39U0Y1_9PEZI|nr:hypothetical protein B0T14DRAFT_343471 [Immersiella caudata]
MPSVSNKQLFITSSPGASSLYNRLWMSNSAPPGQVLVAQLDPATDSTKLLSLEAKSLRSYLGFGPSPDGTVDGARPLLACRAEPQLGAEVLCIPRGREGGLLHHLGRDEGGLGLGSVLTNHREENDLEDSAVLHRNFGRSQFRIVSPGQESGSTSGDVYFSVEPELYTPDNQHPFRGVWIWELEAGKFEFLLLHQESEHRLELIKLTGVTPVPNGSTSIVARDIRTVKRCSSESDDEWKWNDVRIVDAKIQGSDSVGGDGIYP